MNSEDMSNAQTDPSHTVTPSGGSAYPGYDAEGLAIKEEGAKEGNIYPGIDAEYPLREASEDPTWAVRIATIWAGITIFCIVGILTLMTLGIWYD